MKIDSSVLDSLLERSAGSPRLRMNLDLRTSATCPGSELPSDSSQRMLNALLPGTQLPIHRHRHTTETLVVLRGSLEEIYYEEIVTDGDLRNEHACGRPALRESERILLSASGPVYGLCIPVGRWHTVNVLEPTVILECKDGAYEPLAAGDMIDR